MPIAQTAFFRTTFLLLTVGVAALIAILTVNAWLVDRSSSYFDDAIQARNLRAASVAVRYALQDIETGQRGFLLTGEEEYLEPYRTGVSSVEGRLQQLQEAVASDPGNQALVAELGEAIEFKLAETLETVELMRAGRAEAAIEIVRTDRGKANMDQARAALETIIADADRQLGLGVATQRANMQALQWITLAGAVVILLVVGGSVWLAVSHMRDLTTTRGELQGLNAALEQTVGERTEELRRANEEVQRFAYIVTHDLRAPLVNIMGFTSELDETMKTIQAYVLADEKPLNEQDIHAARTAARDDLPEAIDFIRSSTRKMDGLINAILKISRDGRRQLNPEDIDLTGLIQTAADSVQHQLAENGGEITVAGDLPSVIGDRLSLEQIFGNLIDNAIKYRAPERPIRVEVTGERVLGGRVRIEVKDNGRGIAESDHQRVFDLFRRSGTQDQPGEGIGLAHVRSLVRNLGGDINLQSEYGSGSSFIVLLPSDFTKVVRSAAR